VVVQETRFGVYLRTYKQSPVGLWVYNGEKPAEGGFAEMSELARVYLSRNPGGLYAVMPLPAALLSEPQKLAA
jgi:hypothetical protein